MCVCEKNNMKQVMAGPNFTIFNHIPPTFDGGPMLFLLFFCLKCLVLFFDVTAFSSMGITSPQEQQDCEYLLCLSCRYMLSQFAIVASPTPRGPATYSCSWAPWFRMCFPAWNFAHLTRQPLHCDEKRLRLPCWTLQCFGRDMKDST